MIGGGQNICDFFRVKKNTGGTDYEILQGYTGSTVATTRTHKLLTLDELVDTKPTFQEDGTVKVSFENYKDDSAMLDFLDGINPPTASASAGKPEVKFENGIKKGGSVSSSDAIVLMVSYGAASEDDTDIKLLVAIGNILRTSGSYGQKADDWSKSSFEFSGIKAEFALEIAAAIFHSGDGGLVDATDVATAIPAIPANAGFVRKFVQKHA